ncbi:MAG: zinc metallopeptidase [Lachnospira sp.]|nr:zinc metallopeptidase [Lachnospira sp.]
MRYWYYYYDPTYILIIVAAVISLIAQLLVSSRFSKYSKVSSRAGFTGAQAASHILQSQGIYDVSIRRVSGNLTDHYDPRSKTLNLSESVYDNYSVAAIGVAAHECGHAIQHARGYAPLTFRSALVPVANLGSKLSWLFIILGIIFSMNQTLLYIGIIMFSAAVLFQLVTLPVEFNASGRALKLLKETGILRNDEVSKTRKVLAAAALTYVAAAATAILQLLRLILLFGGRDRD